MADVICNECGKINDDMICRVCFDAVKNDLSDAEIELYKQEKEIAALNDRIAQLTDDLMENK
jgi:hypothetical protein